MKRNFMNFSRRAIIILVISLLVQIVSFAILAGVAKSRGVEFSALTGDAKGYQLLAENLLKHGFFSFSQAPPFFPDSFRTPGYPLFLAILYFFTRSWIAVLFFQGLIVSILPLLLYYLGRKFHERTAFVAAILFIFEPTRIFLSNSILTDALFAVFFLLSLLLFLDLRNSSRRSFFSGLVLGVATITRPIALYLPLIFLPFFWFTIADKRRYVTLAPLFLAGFFLVLFPWSLRNKILFHSWQLSSVGSANLATYNVTEFIKYKTGVSTEEANKTFEKLQEGIDPHEAVSLRRISVLNDFAKKYIKEDPIGYAKFHLVKTIPFFVTDGLRDIARSLRIIRDTPPNFSNLIAHLRWKEVANFFREGGPEVILFISGVTFWLLINVFAFAGALRMIVKDRERRSFALLIVLLILYFAILTGPVSNARYRMPVSGFLLLLATSCVFGLLKNRQKNIT